MSAVEDLLRRAATDLRDEGARFRGFARGRSLVRDFEGFGGAMS